MGMFKQVEGENAVIVESGVYRQADLYNRDGYLYAKAGPGFVRLYADGSTSKAKCRLDALSFYKPLCADKFGRLCDTSVTGASPLGEAKERRLLLGGGDA
jgi:hypothetical protein